MKIHTNIEKMPKTTYYIVGVSKQVSCVAEGTSAGAQPYSYVAQHTSYRAQPYSYLTQLISYGAQLTSYLIQLYSYIAQLISYVAQLDSCGVKIKPKSTFFTYKLT